MNFITLFMNRINKLTIEYVLSEWESDVFFTALAANTSLTHLSIYSPKKSEGLRSVLMSNTTLTSLTYHSRNLDPSDVLIGLTYNTNIQRLEISDVDEQSVNHLVKLLNTNTKITSLRLTCVNFTDHIIPRSLIDALSSNTVLETLLIQGIKRNEYEPNTVNLILTGLSRNKHSSLNELIIDVGSQTVNADVLIQVIRLPLSKLFIDGHLLDLQPHHYEIIELNETLTRISIECGDNCLKEVARRNKDNLRLKRVTLESLLLSVV